MIDIRNAALGMQQRLLQTTLFATPAPSRIFSDQQVLSPQEESSESPVALPSPFERRRVSLPDMIATSVALKSGLDIEVVQPSADWSAYLFPTAPSTRSQSRDESAVEVGGQDASLHPGAERLYRGGEHEVSPQVALATAGLQREVLLLRNELNFELWMTRENVKHIGRLYEDRVLSRTAEIERQGLVGHL